MFGDSRKNWPGLDTGSRPGRDVEQRSHLQFRQVYKYPLMHAGSHVAFDLLELDPGDFYLAELCGLEQARIVDEHRDCPFYTNVPPDGTGLSRGPSIHPARICHTDRRFPLPLDRSSSGMLISGLPGSCKTTLAMLIALMLVQAGCLVIVWELKRTWRRLLHLPLLAGRGIGLSIRDFTWSLFQGPRNISWPDWANRVTNVFAQCYGRVSAQRILRDLLNKLKSLLPCNCFPTPRMIIHCLRNFACKSLKEREYVASILWTMVDMVNHFGEGVFSYTYSDMPERLFSHPGRLFIIEDCGLPVHHWNFAVQLMVEWLVAFRRHPQNRPFDVVFILEDCTSLVDPGQDAATPGGVSLLAQNLNICREMRIGIDLVCHSLSQVSRKILVNIENFFCCSLRGDDLSIAGQVLGVTQQQAEFLRVNPRGTACALVPSVWPLPVLVEYPPIMELLR